MSIKGSQQMREYQDIGSAASSADSEVACVLPVPQCQWTVFPARERPAIAAVALVILGLLSAAVGVNAQSFVAAALAFAALFLSLNRFFSPVVLPSMSRVSPPDFLLQNASFLVANPAVRAR